MPHHICGGQGTNLQDTEPNLYFQQHRVSVYLHSLELLSLLTAHMVNKSVHNLH